MITKECVILFRSILFNFRQRNVMRAKDNFEVQ